MLQSSWRPNLNHVTHTMYLHISLESGPLPQSMSQVWNLICNNLLPACQCLLSCSFLSGLTRGTPQLYTTESWGHSGGGPRCWIQDTWLKWLDDMPRDAAIQRRCSNDCTMTTSKLKFVFFPHLTGSHHLAPICWCGCFGTEGCKPCVIQLCTEFLVTGCAEDLERRAFHGILGALAWKVRGQLEKYC